MKKKWRKNFGIPKLLSCNYYKKFAREKQLLEIRFSLVKIKIEINFTKTTKLRDYIFGIPKFRDCNKCTKLAIFHCPECLTRR